MVYGNSVQEKDGINKPTGFLVGMKLRDLYAKWLDVEPQLQEIQD